MPTSSAAIGRAHLLGLPLELRLAIYELVVVSDEVLLLNRQCETSSNIADSMGTTTASTTSQTSPHGRAIDQPALSRVCTSTRADTISLFYARNLYQAHYCWDANVDTALEWLKRIGRDNRRMLHSLHFYERNEDYDRSHRRDLQHFTHAVNKLDGRVIHVFEQGCCCHRVTFT